MYADRLLKKTINISIDKCFSPDNAKAVVLVLPDKKSRSNKNKSLIVRLIHILNTF